MQISARNFPHKLKLNTNAVIASVSEAISLQRSVSTSFLRDDRFVTSWLVQDLFILVILIRQLAEKSLTLCHAELVSASRAVKFQISSLPFNNKTVILNEVKNPTHCHAELVSASRSFALLRMTTFGYLNLATCYMTHDYDLSRGGENV